jgi:methyl-accepting chemotaxis protein
MELQNTNSAAPSESFGVTQYTASQLKSWNLNCDRIRQQLFGLIQDSERAFLDMGNRFLHYSEQGKLISESSYTATTLFFSDTVMNAIEELYELLDRIRRYLQYNETELSNNSEILQNILKTIQSIHHPFDQFEKLVKKLGFLGISTRIESSRLRNTDKSFETLSQDVKNLSNKIDKKLNSIIEGSSALRNTISQTLSQSLQLKSKQYKQAKQILKNTHSCLQVLIDTNEKSSATAQSLADQAKTIENHISEIVESIQFQDIIRQKVEHIIQAVDDIKKIIESGTQLQSDAIIEIGDISELQVEQLKVAEQEILTAINSMISGLSGIAQNLDSII